MKARHRTAALALGLALLSSGAVAEPATHQVVIEGMRFTPATLTVVAGERIVWVNRDLVPHTVTAVAPAAARPVFDSGPIAPGASWTLVASASGRFAYRCTLHPTMKAELIVRPR